MKFQNVKIITVGDVRSGISQSTGKPWASRTILLGFEDETGESYLTANVDEDVWQRLGLEQGQVADVRLRMRTRRFNNGYVANDIRIIEPKNEMP